MDNRIRCPVCKKCFFEILQALHVTVRIKCPVCKNRVVLKITKKSAADISKIDARINDTS
jgi:phage FluMu protein Com